MSAAPRPVSGHTAVFALVGHPVAHSLSPALHNPLFQAHGVDGVYVVHPVDPARADALGPALDLLGFAGANLTVPFKQSLLSWVDHLDPLVQQVGALNTVVRRDDGWWGYNTDAPGFVAGLIAEHGPVVQGARVLVLGAGGAGRAVGVGLASAGAASVTWCNRTQARAEALVRAVAPAFSGVAFRSAPLTACADLFPQVDLVVNALSGPGARALGRPPVERLPAEAVWTDLNYWDPNPPGLAEARARGLAVQDGLPMLAYQGVLAFEHFTGCAADGAAVLRRLRQHTAAR